MPQGAEIVIHYISLTSKNICVKSIHNDWQREAIYKQQGKHCPCLTLDFTPLLFQTQCPLQNRIICDWAVCGLDVWCFFEYCNWASFSRCWQHVWNAWRPQRRSMDRFPPQQVWFLAHVFSLVCWSVVDYPPSSHSINLLSDSSLSIVGKSINLWGTVVANLKIYNGFSVIFTDT